MTVPLIVLPETASRSVYQLLGEIVWFSPASTLTVLPFIASNWTRLLPVSDRRYIFVAPAARAVNATTPALDPNAVALTRACTE
ncbi:hypothetical protein Ade02nite_11020 [Paractinoplanes deccanensis]|uniref:Uncharacterized protein n=1 Tax=Paractinoplanes deccanensis TaxID=113561 RepID=A0ABQ3XXI1_9ACTN|nr:hypothetical protein Ade02nite_11020 [Actinoplanes deccanensis]